MALSWRKYRNLHPTTSFDIEATREPESGSVRNINRGGGGPPRVAITWRAARLEYATGASPIQMASAPLSAKKVSVGGRNKSGHDSEGMLALRKTGPAHDAEGMFALRSKSGHDSEGMLPMRDARPARAAKHGGRLTAAA